MTDPTDEKPPLEAPAEAPMPPAPAPECEAEPDAEPAPDTAREPDDGPDAEISAEPGPEAPGESPGGAEPASFAEQLRLVEALLFAAAAPLPEEAIAARLHQGGPVLALLAELEAFYRPRGVNLVKIAGGWTLRTAPDLAPRLRLETTVARRLSRAAVETLAIVAYHQPVTRAEIEEIRGVVISKGTLDSLMEAGWIMPRGRRQTPGRPATWVTTDKFLEHFGLAGLGDLPGVEELKAAGLIGPRPVTALGEGALPAELPMRPEPAAAEGEGEEEPAGPEPDAAPGEPGEA